MLKPKTTKKIDFLFFVFASLLLLCSVRFSPVVDSFAFTSPSSTPPRKWRRSGLSKKSAATPAAAPAVRPKTGENLFLAACQSGDDEGENREREYFTNRKNRDFATPKNLVWNLSALLSQETDTQGKLHPLMKVYNAAMDAKQQIPSSENHALGIQSLAYTGSLSPSVAPARLFVRKYSHDMGHDGRFSIFTDDHDDIVYNHNGNEEEYVEAGGGSLQSDVVFSMDDPLKYIRENLSYRDENLYKSYTAATNLGCAGCDNSEVIIFCPGPHTFHEYHQSFETGKRTATERLKYYSKVLGGLPMAQLHAGTYMDQGDTVVELSQHTIKSLQYYGLLVEDDDFEIKKNELGVTEGSMADAGVAHQKNLWCLRAKDLDIIRAVLVRRGAATFNVQERSRAHDDNEQLQRTLFKLIDTAVRNVQRQNFDKEQSPHLVLFTHSATSNILAAALAEWKQQATGIAATKVGFSNGSGKKRNNRNSSLGDTGSKRQVLFSEQEAERLLREALTVVTVGALGKGFVNGPAYIHISMHDDLLASKLGVSKQRPEGGGQDAVYLHAISPYALYASRSDDDDFQEPPSERDGLYTNDAHNMDACAVQFLSLIRRINGVTSFRELYNLGSQDRDRMDIKEKASLYTITTWNAVGQLEMPPHLDDELLPSMIRATGGERWLWNPNINRVELLGDGGGVDGFDAAQAEMFLTYQLGYNIYDEIVKACSSQ